MRPWPEGGLVVHDVFISYSSKDKVVADAVCAALEADHIRCYIAPRDVLPGQRYAQALVDAIHDAKVFVLVFSAASNSSNQVEREVDRAVSCGLPVLPLRLEDVMPCDWLEYYLAGQHWLDALTPPLENHLTRLSEAITVLLQPPAKGARSQFKDEWRDGTPGAAKQSPAERPVPEAAPSVAPAAIVSEKPPEDAKPPVTVEPPVASPPVTEKPPVASPPVTEKPPDAAKPLAASAPFVAPPAPKKPAEADKPPAVPPPVTEKPPEPTKPPATARPADVASAAASAAAKVTAPAPASAAAPKPTTRVKGPARPGKRPAMIAAVVVGVSWVGVLLAVELLFR